MKVYLAIQIKNSGEEKTEKQTEDLLSLLPPGSIELRLGKGPEGDLGSFNEVREEAFYA